MPLGREVSSAVISIRDAGEGDALAVADVKVRALEPIYGPLGHPSLADDLDLAAQQSWLGHVLRHGAADSFFVVAEECQQAVGWVRGVLESEEDHTYGGWLSGIFVVPSHQRVGVGRRLMWEAAVRFRAGGAESMRLQVLSSSPSAGFYERLGGLHLGEVVLPSGLVEKVYGWRDIGVLERA